MFFEKYLRHSVFKNFIALFSVQAINYVNQFFLVTYVTRILGPENWGLLAYTQSFATYVGLTIEYGFDYSGTKKVAQNRDNKKEISNILSSVMSAKVVLGTGAVIISLIIAPFLPLFPNHSIYFFLSILLASGQGFNFSWFFQGMGNVRRIANIDIVIKILTMLLIIFTFKSPEQAWLLLVIQISGMSIFLICQTIIIRVVHKIKFTFSFSGAIQGIKESFFLFMFRSSASLYIVSNSFILGFFASTKIIGWYNGAERIFKAVIGLLGPSSQALFPMIANLLKTDRIKAYQVFKKVLLIQLLIGLSMALSIILLAPVLVRILLGDQFEGSINTLRVLGIMPIFISLSNALGIQWMIPLGLDKAFSVLIMASGIVSVICSIILAPIYGHLGMAISFAITELFVCLSIFLYLKIKGLLKPTTFKN